MITTQRDIIFLVRGIPDAHLIQHRGIFFMAPLGKPYDTKLKEEAKKIPPLKLFLDESPDARLVCVGFRNNCKDVQSAIEKASKALAGIIDGFAFVIDGNLPKVCSVVQIRESNAAHGVIKVYSPTGWAHFHPRTPESASKWKEREEKLLTRCLTFFDIVTMNDAKHQNDLCYQLRYSSKMCRCGIEAHNFGIEYLCKFSALEGLVCGGITHNKHKHLVERLSKLFTKSSREVKADVDRLWSFRNSASHQAKAFHDEDIPDSKPIQLEIVTLEYYLTGVLVFALEHVENAESVDELWSKVVGYALPEYALLERPLDMPKLPISILGDTPFVVNGIGASIDALFGGQVSQSTDQNAS